MQSSRLKQIAHDAGFELAGIAPVGPAPDFDRYSAWVDAGMAADMGYLTDRRAAVRSDPRHLLPSAQSVICVGKLYNRPEAPIRDPGRGWISRYAWGEDYHDVLRAGLTRLVELMTAELGAFDSKICVDTAPL